MKNFMKEFKEFAMKGNVIDLAIGVVIGGAFNGIVTSFVNDIMMPFFAAILGETTFAELVFVLRKGGESGPVEIRYGSFIQNVINFLIIAMSIFITIKAMNALSKHNEAQAEVIEETPEVSKDTELLEAILVELKKKA